MWFYKWIYCSTGTWILYTIACKKIPCPFFYVVKKKKKEKGCASCIPSLAQQGKQAVSLNECFTREKIQSVLSFTRSKESKPKKGIRVPSAKGYVSFRRDTCSNSKECFFLPTREGILSVPSKGYLVSLFALFQQQKKGYLDYSAWFLFKSELRFPFSLSYYWSSNAYDCRMLSSCSNRTTLWIGFHNGFKRYTCCDFFKLFW